MVPCGSVEPLPVVVHDPKGPVGWRLLPYAGGLVGFAATLGALAAQSVPAIACGAIATMAAIAAAPLLPGRWRPRRAELEVHPGHVRVHAGAASQTLRPQDVEGASTADRGGGRVVMSIARRGRSGVPIALELDSAADAARVRDALGIGHAGFGAVVWPLRPRGEGALRAYAKVALGLALAAYLLLALAVLALGGLVEGPAAAGVLVLVFVLGFLALLSVAHRGSGSFTPESEPRIALWGDGLHLAFEGAARTLPFSDVASAATERDRLVIETTGGERILLPFPPTELSRGLSREDQAVVLAQIRAAAARARGLGTPRPEVPETVGELAHRPSEPAIEWLARVERSAALLRQGYRGATFEPEDLWSVLDDPDAPADLRAAAARILVRVDDGARPRVAALAEATRDDRERLLLLTADSDAEAFAPEIDAALEDLHARRAKLTR